MAAVILCYASQDEAVAGRLAAAVAGLGYSLWSEDDLTAEGSGADITDRISPAKAAIVIWSEAAAASEWVRAEANFARGQKKLIQASVDDRPPPSTVEPPPAPPNGPRINRRNSQNMRLFCQRAGRGTPQCRSFARQLRNERR